VQLKLFGRKLIGHVDKLQEYEIRSIEITDEKFLNSGEDKMQKTLVFTGNNKDIVEGKRLEMTTDELILSDSYEPFNYRRKEVTLQSGRKAWIYIAR